MSIRLIFNPLVKKAVSLNLVFNVLKSKIVFSKIVLSGTKWTSVTVSSLSYSPITFTSHFGTPEKAKSEYKILPILKIGFPTFNKGPFKFSLSNLKKKDEINKNFQNNHD